MRLLVENFGDVRVFKDRSLFGVPRYVIEFFEDSLAFLLFQTEEKPFPFKNNSEEEVVIEAEEIEDSSSKQETD